MRIILILTIVLIVLNASGCSDKEQLSKEQISKIERMVDTRDPKMIAGSFELRIMIAHIKIHLENGFY